MAGLSGRDLAQATGLSNMLRQLGGAVGIALINLFLNTRTSAARNSLVANVTEFSDYATERLAVYAQQLATAGYPSEEATTANRQLLNTALTKQQAVVAYDQGFFMMGLAMLSCLPLIAFIRYRKGSRVAVKNDH